MIMLRSVVMNDADDDDDEYDDDDDVLTFVRLLETGAPPGSTSEEVVMEEILVSPYSTFPTWYTTWHDVKRGGLWRSKILVCHNQYSCAVYHLTRLEIVWFKEKQIFGPVYSIFHTWYTVYHPARLERR